MSGKQAPTMRLRPHHVYCQRFAPWNLPERGEAFNQVERSIRKTLQTGIDTIIEVAEGIDILCRECPLRDGDRCESGITCS
jgi:hypothetical protein